MKYFAKFAASALFSASLITFGAADPVLDTVPVAQAMSSDCALGDYLDQIWNRSITNYRISSTAYGTAVPASDFNAQIYIRAMMDGTSFTEVKGWEAPEGQYVVLELPDQGVRYEFFYGKDGNYIREVDGAVETFYHAEFSGRRHKACDVIEDWGREMYDEAPSAGDISGRWVESVAKRASINVVRNGSAYDVTITWPNGAAEEITWQMTAVPAGRNTFSYEDCECIVRTYSPDGSSKERVRYENGTGRFTLDGDMLTWDDDVSERPEPPEFFRS